MTPFTRCFADGESVFEQGDPAPSMYMVVGGKVRVFRTLHGVEVDLDIVGRGQLVGEVAFLTSQLHSASAEAVGPTELWLISAEDMEGFAGDPLAHRMLVTLATRLRTMDDEYERLTVVTERQRRFLDALEKRDACA